ncbi:cytochrome P450 [Cellulomonas shaoxiangyii]|uniref:Cytochrome P450 n=1 Tax=Cellulomonas shaoxiangyii TaxID=2566013 RepID=A0A4P7SJQ1_9CELL|nr:cytochrome P450 [Cellulomonas shaoxiangyii]QCB93717.1 cytochrome P450 [Cellulomonas shaoxiangyii]TGY80108.1 cytochrome P450 [Cellulomonas shaoxiangyii]
MLTTVLAPMLARGPIVRRPRVGAAAERLGADARAADVLAGLAERYERRPVAVTLGRRRMVLPLHHDDGRAVLDLSPDPFSPASAEKRAALRHFQPRAVLISPLDERPVLRDWNERALETGRPVHSAGAGVVGALHAIADGVARSARASGALGFEDVDDALWAAARTVTLGPGAQDDATLVDELTALRRRANWAFAVPQDRALRARFTRRVLDHVRRAPLDSLAGAGVVRGGSPVLAATQVPHWMFAFDAARIALWRALAVVAARPGLQDAMRAEAVDAAAAGGVHELPLARAAVLESLRLWPTTLVILRETVAPTAWGDVVLPAGHGVSVVSSWFHRDRERRPAADTFGPAFWHGTTWVGPSGQDDGWLVVPFSAGPVVCPGADVVLLTASTLLSDLVRDVAWRPVSHPALADDPLPPTLSHTGLRLGAGTD